MGRFTKKIQRHERVDVIIPPSVGPVLTPSATTTALSPSALPRSCAGKALVSIAGLMAMISAPPRPCNARAAINSPSEGAKPQKADPTVKMIRPAAQIGLRPIISDIRPAVSNTPAVTTRYAIITHSISPLRGTPKELAIAGRLIFTIDESSVAIKTPMATMTNTAHLFACSVCLGPGVSSCGRDPSFSGPVKGGFTWS